MIEFLSIIELRVSQGWHLPLQSHPHHELLMFMSGEHHCSIAENDFHSRSGDVILFPAGYTHKENILNPGGAHWFCCTFDAPHAQVVELGLQQHDRSGRIRVLCEWLRTDTENTSTAIAAARNAYLEAILREIAVGANPHVATLVTSIRRFVLDNLDQPLSLERLAETAQMSRFHFSRRYQSLAGISPMADVRRIRLERARELLLSTDLPLKAIAPRVGLGDTQALSRLIRQHFGYSSRQMRRGKVGLNGQG